MRGGQGTPTCRASPEPVCMAGEELSTCGKGARNPNDRRIIPSADSSYPRRSTRFPFATQTVPSPRRLGHTLTAPTRGPHPLPRCHDCDLPGTNSNPGTARNTRRTNVEDVAPGGERESCLPASVATRGPLARRCPVGPGLLGGPVLHETSGVHGLGKHSAARKTAR